MSQVLEGVRIVEFASIGPGPFAAMMLADHGAHVVRIERPGEAGHGMPVNFDVLLRNRAETVQLDLRSETGRNQARALLRGADGLIEGFRPGVMERLGLGPATLLGDNPNLAYGRMTGWGQDGALARRAGHDINYIALSGTLHALGRAGEKPTPPANLIGDFGGGGMLLAFGMLAAILNARSGGGGRVIDCAMVDGAALLFAMQWGMRAAGLWVDERGKNLLDTGAPFYDVYETEDGGYVAFGALEPMFFANFLAAAGLEGDPDFAAQYDRATWPRMRERLTELFRSQKRDWWTGRFENEDSCVTPVLCLAEAPLHPHNRMRNTFTAIDGAISPSPAPRFDEPQRDSPDDRVH